MLLFGIIMLIGVILDFVIKLAKLGTLDLGNVLLGIFITMTLPYLG
jgi:hypothetical protein